MQTSLDKLMVFHGKTMEKLPAEMFLQSKGFEIYLKVHLIVWSHETIWNVISVRNEELIAVYTTIVSTRLIPTGSQ